VELHCLSGRDAHHRRIVAVPAKVALVLVNRVVVHVLGHGVLSLEAKERPGVAARADP
jgi:hypothetical protein